MGSLSTSFFIYMIFLLMAFVSGTIYWIRNRYNFGAASSLILSLLAPLMTVLLAAQRDTATRVVDYVLQEMRAGNAWARLLVIIHIYLISWLLFMLFLFIRKAAKSPEVKEKIQKLLSKKEDSEILKDEEKQTGSGQ